MNAIEEIEKDGNDDDDDDDAANNNKGSKFRCFECEQIYGQNGCRAYFDKIKNIAVLALRGNGPIVIFGYFELFVDDGILPYSLEANVATAIS